MGLFNFMGHKKKANYPLLIFSIILSQSAGILGSFFTAPAIPTWYASLAKPAFNPPAWLFAPVWITLFTLMGIALYLVLIKGANKPEIKKGAYLFGIQLLLNALWSILFFGLQSPGLAFAEILVLWAAIAATIWQFNKIDRRAAYLLIPYILWVSFAAILNFSIWQLN
jgi:tryptophan-rich sensory protein